MRILLLAHSFNSLTQRLWIELEAWGHEVSLELDVNDAVTSDAVRRWSPDVVIAPFLKRAIPESVWSRVRCLVVHPGIVGDRGPSALDWAVQDDESRWGVTVLQANAEMDAGDVWASVEFDMRSASKGSLYRNEVTEAAVEAAAHGACADRAGRTRHSADGNASRARPTAAADAPGRSRDRLAARFHRRSSCASSARRTARRAWPTKCSDCRCTATTPIPKAACAARRAKSSPSATAPSAAPRSTAPCGSRT